MLTSQKKSIEVTNRLPKSEEDRLEKERMRDVLVLLEHLLEREETTVQLIVDRLYDVGSVNYINKRFARQPRKRWAMKSVAKMLKPAVKVYAMRWVKKNCPQLITNWLQNKVRF